MNHRIRLVAGKAIDGFAGKEDVIPPGNLTNELAAEHGKGVAGVRNAQTAHCRVDAFEGRLTRFETPSIVAHELLARLVHDRDAERSMITNELRSWTLGLDGDT